MSSNGRFTVNYKNLKIDFPINNAVNVITGESTSGKTKLMKDLYNALQMFRVNNDSVECSVDISKVDVVNMEFIQSHGLKIEEIYKDGGYILFIDNYDRFDNMELRKFVFRSRNIFFAVSRKVLPNCVAPRALNALVYEDGTYRLVNYISDRARFTRLIGYND